MDSHVEREGLVERILVSGIAGYIAVPVRVGTAGFVKRTGLFTKSYKTFPGEGLFMDIPGSLIRPDPTAGVILIKDVPSLSVN